MTTAEQHVVRLDKIEAMSSGVVPFVFLIKKTDKVKVNHVQVDSLHAMAGYAAIFVDAEWPKYVLYLGSESEAGEQAALDLARLNEPDPDRRAYFARRLDDHYWIVTPPGRCPHG